MPTFTHSGRQIHYRSQGSFNAPIVLILPGNTASSALHTAELAFFESLGYHAVALDYPGTGKSERLSEPWPVDWFEKNAAVCAALIEHLGFQQAVLCGTSGGAIVALWTAILFPTRVRAVIADSEAIRFNLDNLRALEADRAKRSPGQIHFWSDAHGPDWDKVVDGDTGLFQTLMRERGGQTGIWEIHQGRLGEIRCPVLFTCALTDDLVPEIGPQMLEMSAQVPGSRFFSTNQGWHPLMWSQPKDFQAAVQVFLSQINNN